MVRQEIVQILTLLAGNYESFAKRTETDEQVEIMINTWQECLGDLDYDIVLRAVKKTIINSPYPPTIHEIRKNAVEFINPTTQKTAIEAWNEALNMISGGIYMTEEQFNHYSPEVRKYFGTVNNVRQHAMLSADVVNSVVKGQFLKQYDVLVEREKEDKLLPPDMKNTFNLLADKMDVNKLLGGEVE